MSKLQEFLDEWSNLEWWRHRAVPWAGRKIRHGTTRKALEAYGDAYYRLRGKEYVSIPDADWDNILILDACRYDFFVQQHRFDETPELRYSRAPQTPSFLRRNFGDGNFHDIVVVSANPNQGMRLDDDQFHDVYHVWETHWDEEYNTVTPSAVNEVAEEAAETYPDKRLLVHYIQPHAPFVGPWARENIGIYADEERTEQKEFAGTELEVDNDNPYFQLRRGEISRNKVINGYRENLQLVLAASERLLAELDGRTVVTSDHGELFDERAYPYLRREVLHPPLKAEKLLQVPWLVHESGERRETVADPPVGDRRDLDDDGITERLNALGYK